MSRIARYGKWNVNGARRRCVPAWTARERYSTMSQNKHGRERDLMKFGIFYELQLPRPWEAGDELRLDHDELTQHEMSDRLSHHYAWVVEHHFLEEYSHSPAPEAFLAAASQRTNNIRLGHGIFQLTTTHPARVAERIAVLD